MNKVQERWKKAIGEPKNEENNTMKCPLRGSDRKGAYDHAVYKTADCLKEECAWWGDGEEGCLIVFIERDLAGIWTLLTTIANKMPHEEQFRK